MFDLQDDSKTRVIKTDNPIDRLPPSSEGRELMPRDGDHPLDSEDARELHSRLVSYYRQELDRQSENRFQMAADEDYLDNIQWTEEDAAILRDRGQAPLVYNVISTSVRWVLGTEKRSRMDFKVLPRRKEEGKPAEKKTALLKYLSDVNRTPFSRSRAFKDGVTVGLGWLETGIQDESDGEEPIYDRYESWRNILWDSSATENDLSDSRYMFRTKWVDVDVAKALFPDRKEQIDMAVVEGEQFGTFDGTDGDEPMDYAEFHREDFGIARNIVSHKRRRVRLIECWYKKPERRQRITKGPWKGQIFDPNEPRHQEYGETLAEKLTFTMRCAIMTAGDLLYDGESPYRHNRFPFIPIWGYRRGRDGLPYGMVRGLRDIQDDINKRAAKAQHILSTNKVIMDEGAVPDLDEFREEVAHADAILVKRKGYDLQLNVDRELAPAHLDLMSRGIQMIQQVGGVTDELLARQTNATSGVAIQRRQEQGSLATSDFFDNLRFAEQLRGEIELSLIEQFMTEPKQFRITNMRGNADFVELNSGMPEDDITRSKADFVVSEQDYRATIREAQTQQLIEMVTKLAPAYPQLAMVVFDLIVEGMDIHNRDEIVKRIRQQTGLRDPDATEPTPEEQQAMAASAAQQEQQQRLADAQLRKLEAEATAKEAAAAKAAADAKRTETLAIADRVGAQVSAMNAAREALMTPGAAPVADAILEESGWPQGEPLPEPPAAPQPMPPQAMATDAMPAGPMPPEPPAAAGINPATGEPQ